MLRQGRRAKIHGFRIKELESLNDELELKNREYISEIAKLQRELSDLTSKHEALRDELENTYKALEQL